MPTLSYMEIILTDQCNLRCDYCFEAGKNPHVMSDETAFGAVDFLMDASRDVPNLTILFFGGEPLLRFDLLQRVHAYANQEAAKRGKQVHYDMTTNGTLITEEKARWLRDNHVKYLLSIDGVGADHDRYRHFQNGRGSFDIVAEKVPIMKRFQPWLGAKMTLTPEGCANLMSNIRTLHEMGINQFVLGYGHGMPWSVQDLVAYEQALLEVCELYLEMKYKGRYFRMTLFEEGEPGKASEHKGFGCGAGRGRFCVDSYGDIYGCSKLATITGMRNGVLPFGNVIQGHTKPDNRAQFLVHEVGPREKCRTCEYNDVCGGGCPAVNYAAKSSIYDPDDLSCRIVFINQRVHAYMRKRHEEVFGAEVGEDPDKANERKANAVCVDV
ncbi:MAG TPA: radical SAM protein [Planctomycetota bacterium]|nr:radical SAM protein [Planctomycetota bacterium]